MKKLLLTVALVFAGIVGTNAQTTDNTEFYAGYQFVRTNAETRITPSIRFNKETDSSGLNLSATEYVSKHIGFTGELAGNFDGNGRNLYTYMGGVTIKANREGKVQPFARGLAGGYTATNQGFLSNKNKSEFAYSLGAGLDVKYKKFGWRVVQVDYLGTRNFNQFDNNVRIGSGFTF